MWIKSILKFWHAYLYLTAVLVESLLRDSNSPNMSSDTGVLKMSPVNSQRVFFASIPEVPSNTWTTAFVPLTSKTWKRTI